MPREPHPMGAVGWGHPCCPLPRWTLSVSSWVPVLGMGIVKGMVKHGWCPAPIAALGRMGPSESCMGGAPAAFSLAPSIPF